MQSGWQKILNLIRASKYSVLYTSNLDIGIIVCYFVHQRLLVPYSALACYSRVCVCVCVCVFVPLPTVLHVFTESFK